MSQTTVPAQPNYLGCFPLFAKSNDRFHRSQMATTKIDLGSWSQRTQSGCHWMVTRLNAACSCGSGSAVQLLLGELSYTSGTSGPAPKLQWDPLVYRGKMENDSQKLVIKALEMTAQHTMWI